MFCFILFGSITTKAAGCCRQEQAVVLCSAARIKPINCRAGLYIYCGSVFRYIPSVDDKVEDAQKERRADDVADSNGDQVAEDRADSEFRRGDRRAFGCQAGLYHKPERQEEHICHAVFKAHGDEGRYGHQQRDEFAGHVERAEGEPDGEADEPVAEEAAQYHL